MVARMRVLVVDDNEDNRDMYATYIASTGSQVVTAPNGMEGLSLAKITRPDAIVLDLAMPRVDGWEVARTLRADPETRDVCIVVVTGDVTADARQRALKAGADSVLTKPCIPSVVFAEIEQRCRDRGRLPRP